MTKVESLVITAKDAPLREIFMMTPALLKVSYRCVRLDYNVCTLITEAATDWLAIILPTLFLLDYQFDVYFTTEI